MYVLDRPMSHTRQDIFERKVDLIVKMVIPTSPYPYRFGVFKP